MVQQVQVIPYHGNLWSTWFQNGPMSHIFISFSLCSIQLGKVINQNSNNDNQCKLRLLLQHPTGQRRARNGRESAKQSPTLPELLFQRRGWAHILFLKHSYLWFGTFFLICSLKPSRLPLIALVFRIEVQQGVIATETKKFTQDSALSRTVGVASW